MDCKHTGEETCRVYPRGIKAGGCSVPDCFEKRQTVEADVRLNNLLNAAIVAETRIQELEAALKMYINAGCMDGTHYVKQKAALDNALRLLDI